MQQPSSILKYRQDLQDRCFDYGLSDFSPREALELALSFAAPKSDVRSMSEKLFTTFGAFSGVLDSVYDVLCETKYINTISASFLEMLPNLARCFAMDWWHSRDIAFRYPFQVHDFFADLLLGENNEKLYLLCLDENAKYITHTLMHEGTVDEVAIYPRMLVKQALLSNARYVVMAHNHPGCNQHPSDADVRCTSEVARALNVVDVILLDHMIIAGKNSSSLNSMHALHNLPEYEDDAVFKRYSEFFDSDDDSMFENEPSDILSWNASRQYGIVEVEATADSAVISFDKYKSK